MVRKKESFHFVLKVLMNEVGTVQLLIFISDLGDAYIFCFPNFDQSHNLFIAYFPKCRESFDFMKVENMTFPFLLLLLFFLLLFSRESVGSTVFLARRTDCDVS